MKRNTKKTILLSFILLVISAISVGLYLFNKGPVNIKNAGAHKIKASALYTLFETDSSSANKKYAGKIVQVKGTIAEVKINQKNEPIVLLFTHNNSGNINATLEEHSANIKPGDIVDIKGICSGIGESEPNLGIKADVYITRAYIIQ